MITSKDSDVAKSAVLGLAGAVIGFAVASLVSEFVNPTYEAVLEALEHHADGSYENGLRDAIVDAVTDGVDRVATSADFGPRAHLFTKLDLGSCEDDVAIQAISLSQKWQTTQVLEELFAKRPNFRARILLMHPYSDHAALREKDLDFPAGQIPNLIDETLHPLASLHEKTEIGDRIEVRGYFAAPYYGLIICDSRRCLVALSREERGGDRNLGILIRSTTPAATSMISDLQQGFHDRWDKSLNLLTLLVLSLTVVESTRTDGLVELHLVSDIPLDLDSVDVAVRGGAVEKLGEKDRSSYELLVRPADPNAQVVVTITRALSLDGHARLGKPVDVVVASVRA